jgi:hypothetical protein
LVNAEADEGRSKAESSEAKEMKDEMDAFEYGEDSEDDLCLEGDGVGEREAMALIPQPE